MPAAKLRPVAAEHDDAAAGHVLAAVVADALDDGERARVAHREALAREPAEERAARRRAVEHGVADDHVLLGGEGRVLGRAHGEHAAGEALAGVVVGVADRASARRPARARRRTTGPAEPRSVKRIVSGGQALGAVRLRDRAREQAADGAVDVADRRRRPRPACRARSRRCARSISSQSSAPGSGESCARSAPPRRVVARRRARASTCVRSTPRAFQCSIASSASSRSTRPIRSSKRADAEPAP